MRAVNPKWRTLYRRYDRELESYAVKSNLIPSQCIVQLHMLLKPFGRALIR